MVGRDLYGYGRPLNSIPDEINSYDSRSRFPNAIQDWSATPRTLKERAMIAFMGEITDKPDWTKKIYNDEIISKWRAERAELEKTAGQEEALTEKMFDYCLKELKDYAKQHEKTAFTPAISADATVYKSDSCIPSDLQAALRLAAAPLEDVPEKHRDWHPYSDGKVLDLVHPSLFPLLYGRSRILPEGFASLADCDKYIGKGDIINVPAEDHVKVTHFPGLAAMAGFTAPKQHFLSSKHQWLPSEVDISNSNQTKIGSYINNLHPKHHSPLYEALEKILARVIPMWDATLAIPYFERRAERIVGEDTEIVPPTGKRPPEDNEDELDEDDIYELDETWERDNRTYIMPDPKEYAPLNLDDIEKVDLRKDFAKQGIQVIFKLANIHLTPETPEYEGGAWHVEGQLNEHICASALYYYDSENITDSHLSFREATNIYDFDDKPYEQGDYFHLEMMYGIEQEGPAVQVLGRVSTKEGRVLTFPNVLQHRVEPFRLQDDSRPGHRKILAMFLVDPHLRIPSTAHVPPQQKEWWREMLLGLDRVGDLPLELAENVIDSTGDFPIDLEEAKRIRLELMEERKLFVEDVEKRIQQNTFSFCEH